MEKKICAVVGVAKCPVTKKMYGVRIGIEGKIWTATWAFPIKPDVAKREGYTENQFPPDLKYDGEYPGCPYCRKREDLVQISKPETRRRSLRMAVTSPGCDDIGSILTSMDIRWRDYNSVGFNCDMLFMNCMTKDTVEPEKLREFVKKGGCLYASDLTDTIIDKAFPGLFDFGGHIGQICTVKADIVDKELREIVGKKIPVVFDLSLWAILNSCRGKTLMVAEPYGKYAGLPLMVKVPYGKGVIFFTCFHNRAQASEREQALLKLLVLKQIGEGGGMSLAEAGESVGVDVESLKAKFKRNW